MFVATAGVASVITGIVQCIPISASSPTPVYSILTSVGGSFDKSVPAKCVNLNAAAYANAAVGILQDVIILLLPLPEIVHLTMTARKKVLLVLMFSVGTVAVLTSILRLPSLHDFATSEDQTCKDSSAVIRATIDIYLGHDQKGSLWSLAEQSVAIICACVPAIRLLLASHLPKMFNFDEPSRGEDNDARRQARKPPSLFHLTSVLSS